MTNSASLHLIMRFDTLEREGGKREGREGELYMTSSICTGEDRAAFISHDSVR